MHIVYISLHTGIRQPVPQHGIALRKTNIVEQRHTQHGTIWYKGDLTWKLIDQQEHQDAWNWAVNAWGRVLLMANAIAQWSPL